MDKCQEIIHRHGERGKTMSTQKSTEGTAEVESTESTEEVVETTGTEKESAEEATNSEAEKWKALSRKHEATAKKLAADAKAWQAHLDSQKTEAEKAAELAEKAQKEAREARRELGLLRTATKHALPENALKFLTGTTEEELEAQALELKELLSAGTPAPQKNIISRQGREAGAVKLTEKEALAQWLANRKS